MKRLSGLFTINPILVKEVRSRMRGPRAFITLTLILLVMGGLMYGMLQLILASTRYSTVLSPQIGQLLFASLAFLELFMICAVTPAVTAGAISGEKEKQTYEMLMATPLSPISILWGKLISALSYVLLLLFAAIPLASIVFIFGGVAPRDMLKALMILLLIAISFGVLGLFLSALFGRTGRATVASFILVVILMIGPIFAAGLVGVLTSSEPPRWILAPSPISALSSTLAPMMGMDMGGSLFYILSGIFNMGVSPISQTSIPRPLYHYSIPFYTLLSLVLYLIATRLIQPTRRWRIPRKELLIDVGLILVVVAAISAAFLATASRYEWAAVTPNPAVQNANTLPAVQVVGPLVDQKRVQVVQAQAVLSETPTPVENNSVLIDEAQAEVYAAVIRQMYTLDHTFGKNPPNWPVLYLMAITDDSVGDPNAQQGDALALADAIKTETVKLLSDLPADEITWIDAREQANIDPDGGQVQNGDGVLFTFGNIYLQDDGSVRVSASLYFGALGAGGKTYILENIDGVWQVTGNTGVEWMS